jgi:hypothetical protein
MLVVSFLALVIIVYTPPITSLSCLTKHWQTADDVLDGCTGVAAVNGRYRAAGVNDGVTWWLNTANGKVSLFRQDSGSKSTPAHTISLLCVDCDLV